MFALSRPFCAAKLREARAREDEGAEKQTHAWKGLHMWQTYMQPTTLEEVLEILHIYKEHARPIAGGTDILVELQRDPNTSTQLMVDITNIKELRTLEYRDGQLILGALLTHNAILASPLCWQYARPLAQACCEVGAPQIRTRATLAGNLITASPAGDTIPPLLAMEAEVVLVSCAGERTIPLREFYCGARQTLLRPDELLREVHVPALTRQQRGLFFKLGLRRTQAIAVVNLAIVLTIVEEEVTDARISLGSVAPTVIRTPEAEIYLRGKRLTSEVCRMAGHLASEASRPIDDIRASASYRRTVLANLVMDALQKLSADLVEQEPKQMVLLETASSERLPCCDTGDLEITLNGQAHYLKHAANKTLLQAIREDANLTGTKNGCAEGECGACTVWLNGQAVFSCLVPALQARGQEVTTIEGLGSVGGDPGPSHLHLLQQAFITHGAVQCGYCIPGMLMAGVKLLQEQEHPTAAQIQIALSGNLCRCTGYKKIQAAFLEVIE